MSTTIPEPAGFSELSKAEQIRYLQALWDRISEKPEDIPVPESHLDLAQERLPSIGGIQAAPDQPAR